MTTLVDAIEQKFEMLSNEPSNELQHVTMYGSPSSVLRRFRTASGSLCLPPVLVMDNSDVASLGDVDRLGQMCAHLTELDLCNNRLDDWPSLLQLLGRMPRLRWLNLSMNSLLRPQDMQPAPAPGSLPQLQTLVLNQVPLTWPLLACLLSAAPNVTELYLCNNTDSLGRTADCPTTGFPAVRQLYFNGNSLPPADWTGLAGWFPSLEKLNLIGSGVRALPDGPEPLLAGLKSLNLSENAIGDWAELEKLNAFPGLTDLRVLDIELAKGRPKGHFRSEAIARLPNVTQLNGTPVTDEERITAERAFLRRCLHSPAHEASAAGCTARVADLEAKYGRLDELAKVSLKPVESVNLVLRYEGQSRPCAVATIQCVRDVKRQVCAQFKLQPAKVAMYYINQGMVNACGPELMNLPGRAFHSYRPEDGDELILRDRH